MVRIKVHFEKREKDSRTLRLLVPFICILLALVFCAILMLALGYDAVLAYRYLFIGGFGSWRNISESILQSIPLMFCGLGVAVASKMSLNNIGAEGQFTMGAFVVTGIALYMPFIPKPLVVPVMLIGAFVAGGLWAILAVLPKALWDVNETIITLMFNYIALLFVDYFLYGSWRDTSATATNLAYSEQLPPHARLAYLGNTRITWIIFVAVLAAILIWLFFSKTTLGYEIRVIGASLKAAKYSGMKVSRNIVFVLLLSGGLAGLGGLAMVTGPVGCLQPNIANGAGYTAIIISYLAAFNPFVVLVVSIFFGGLTQGGYNIQIAGVSSQIVTLIQGLILLFVLGGEIFVRNKIIFTRHKRLPDGHCLSNPDDGTQLEGGSLAS